jgi:hypothetical protein
VNGKSIFRTPRVRVDDTEETLYCGLNWFSGAKALKPKYPKLERIDRVPHEKIPLVSNEDFYSAGRTQVYEDKMRGEVEGAADVKVPNAEARAQGLHAEQSLNTSEPHVSYGNPQQGSTHYWTKNKKEYAWMSGRRYSDQPEIVKAARALFGDPENPELFDKLQKLVKSRHGDERIPTATQTEPLGFNASRENLEIAARQADKLTIKSEEAEAAANNARAASDADPEYASLQLKAEIIEKRAEEAARKANRAAGFHAEQTEGQYNHRTGEFPDSVEKEKVEVPRRDLGSTSQPRTEEELKESEAKINALIAESRKKIAATNAETDNQTQGLRAAIAKPLDESYMDSIHRRAKEQQKWEYRRWSNKVAQLESQIHELSELGKGAAITGAGASLIVALNAAKKAQETWANRLGRD